MTPASYSLTDAVSAKQSLEENHADMAVRGITHVSEGVFQ